MSSIDESLPQEGATPSLPTRTPAWLAGYGAYPRKLDEMSDENWAGWDQAELDHLTRMQPPQT